MDLQVTPITFTARGKRLSKKETRQLIQKGWTIPYYRKLPIEVNPSPWQRLKRYIAEKLGI